MRYAGLFFLLRSLLLSVLLLVSPGYASAAVEITFYSHDFGSSFPHAFIALSGTDGQIGEKIDYNYGFTATHISPAILIGSVPGEIMSKDAQADRKYIAGSNRHFTFSLSDAEHEAVKYTIAKWQAMKQPSYNLSRQNCVHFVAEVAASLGMLADRPKALMKKPKSYTDSLAAANRAWLLARGATIYR